MEEKNEFELFIQTHGYPIYGTGEFALKYDDALFAVKFAEMLDIFLLGGDVYYLQNNKLVPAYENWYLTQKENESKDDFYKRSWKESEEYIKKFPKDSNAEAFFVLVSQSL